MTYARPLAAFMLTLGCLHAADPAKDSLEETFKNPPVKARPYVWWHWMGSNFSKEGITKDLEAMKEEGVVQATILNIGLFEGRDFGVPATLGHVASPDALHQLLPASGAADLPRSGPVSHLEPAGHALRARTPATLPHEAPPSASEEPACRLSATDGYTSPVGEPRHG